MSKEIGAYIKSGAIYKSVKRVRELMKCELCFNELSQTPHIYTTVTNPRTDRFITLTHLRRRFQTATCSARQCGISKQTVLRRLRQARQPIGQGGPMWDKCLQHVIGLPVCSGHNGISVVGDSSGLGFYSLMSLGLTLFIMTVEFEFLEEEENVERFVDNCLIERDRFGGGSVMVWGGIMGRRKTNLIVVQGNLNGQGYINQILQPEAVPFLKRHGPAILMDDNARHHFARICRQFLNRNNVNVLPWPAVEPDKNPIEHCGIILVERFELEGTYTVLGIWKTR